MKRARLKKNAIAIAFGIALILVLTPVWLMIWGAR